MMGDMGRSSTALLLFLAVVAVTFALPSHRWDVAVTTWLQRASPTPDVPASAFVFLGNAEVVGPAALVAALFFWPRDRGRSVNLFAVAAGLFVLSAIAFGLKFILPHPGPPLELQRPGLNLGVSVPQPFSFPSGHTTRTTFIAATVLRRAPVAAAVLIVAMMTALVYLGDHWTSDVLGGLCLGWAGAEVAHTVRRRLARPAT
jgi:membrane-associated phospholipid phosphatase